jgi:hypothetical protein
MLPNVEYKGVNSSTPTAKMFARKSSIERKLRSTISPQMNSSQNNNYFLNGTLAKN